MQILKFGGRAAACFAAANLLLACQGNGSRSGEPAPTALREVPSVRLNYRYEADVPPPGADANQPTIEERNAAVQADFDATRQFEILDRTYTSPDKKWVVAIYHRLSDLPGDYRLDMYTADGKLTRKLTSDAMAVHFPETLRWSPDSANLAFLAAFRRPSVEPEPSPTVLAEPEPSPSDEAIEATPSAEPATATPAPPSGILVLRTEQVYIANADGTGVKPLTQTDGLKYYYVAWSPDSAMIAAMAATDYEWSVMRAQAESRGEHLIPRGRPRIVEKNGRERRLDDNITNVWPVWSPDSSKVATAFETQVRIYDAAGVNPTQAAIPLRNQMLLSAKAYDENVARASDPSAEANANPAPTPQPPEPSILPDEKSLVSYNPIVEMVWSADDLLYLKTAFVRRTLNEADSAVSFLRWHRIVLSAQIAPTR